MAKILYGVCGVGMGHTMRSTQIIKQLEKDNEIMLASYGASFDYLKKNYKTAKELQWFQMIYKDSQYQKAQTIIKNIPRFPQIIANNYSKFINIIKNFKPEIVISDFEINSIYVGELLRLPTIGISNMHLMDSMDLDLEMKDRIMFYLTEKPILNAFNSAKKLFVSHFAKPQYPIKGREYFRPILREEVLNSKPKTEEHFIVYMPNEKADSTMKLLKETKEKFIVYGNRSGKDKNIKYKKFDDKEFLEDLSTSRGFICHGGFIALSEALYLNKPVYVATEKNFFERYFNGMLVEKNRLGLLEEKPTLKGLKEFFKYEAFFKRNIKKADIGSGNKTMTKRIKQIIKDTEKNKNIKKK